MSFALLSKMATLKMNHIRHAISIMQKSTTNMAAISQKLNNRLIRMEFSSVAVFPTLLKREDYKRTTNDNLFSEWQNLIRSNDWEDFKNGKKGVSSRYRLEGLPSKRCTGLYELGVAAPIGHEDLGQKLDRDNVLATYLGESVDVRSRLQEYGRCAAHLPASYFEDIFSKGSIYYRWAPMGSKWEVVGAKRMLLSKFDYPWNKLSNGERRQLHLLQKFGDCEFMSKRKLQVLVPFHRDTYG